MKNFGDVLHVLLMTSSKFGLNVYPICKAFVEASFYKVFSLNMAEFLFTGDEYHIDHQEILLVLKKIEILAIADSVNLVRNNFYHELGSLFYNIRFYVQDWH